MKKRIFCMVTSVALFLCTLFSAFSDSWNGEGTGGEIGSAISNTYIVNASAYTGIRVSVVDDSGARVEGTRSVDYMWNVSGGNGAYHFSGKRNKIEYRAFKNVGELTLVKGGYEYRNASEFVAQLGSRFIMPNIVISSGSNIRDIRFWLTDQAMRVVPNKIAMDCGLPPTSPYESNQDYVHLYRNTLCRNDYHLLIEPVGSVIVQGVPYVGTATELAFLGQKSGCAWTYLGTYIDMQLPLSMYLSYTQLGIPAASFSATRQSREDIITYLGCAITTYQKDGTDITDDPYRPEDDPQPDIPVPPSTYTYHVGTSVYSSVKIINVSDSDITDSGYVDFAAPSVGLQYRMDGISLPAGGSQLAYCRWTTPSSPGTVSISATCSEGIQIVSSSGTSPAAAITARITGYSGQDPPDPQYSDARGNWQYPSSVIPSSSRGNTWGHWEYGYDTGADKEIDVWYYHESGSQSFHKTGNQLISRNRIDNSSYYRYVSSTHHPAEYSFGPWITHTDEPWQDPGEGYDLNGPPFSTRSVVTYLGTAPYYTRVTSQSRTPLSWGSGTSAGSSAQSVYRGNVFYTLGGSTFTSEPSPSSEGQTLLRYTYRNTVSTGGYTAYMYTVTRYTSSYGSWVTDSVNYINLATDYPTSRVVNVSRVSRIIYLRIRIDYSTRTYTGPNSIVNSRSDTAVWNRMVSYTDYFSWQERTMTLVSEPYDEYVYDMYDTSWNDSGSHWTTGSYYISTQQKVWKWIEESVSVVAGAVISPDTSCPTAYEEGGIIRMKSGYGIRIDYVPVITALGSSKSGSVSVTPLQRIEARFPEFGFGSYRRVLERTGTDSSGNRVYGFMKNKYSRFLSRVHFTPLWYPDGNPYTVRVFASDLWTPAGQVAFWTESGQILIDGGTMYDDWAIGLYQP